MGIARGMAPTVFHRDTVLLPGNQQNFHFFHITFSIVDILLGLVEYITNTQSAYNYLGVPTSRVYMCLQFYSWYSCTLSFIPPFSVSFLTASHPAACYCTVIPVTNMLLIGGISQQPLHAMAASMHQGCVRNQLRIPFINKYGVA